MIFSHHPLSPLTFKYSDIWFTGLCSLLALALKYQVKACFSFLFVCFSLKCCFSIYKNPRHRRQLAFVNETNGQTIALNISSLRITPEYGVFELGTVDKITYMVQVHFSLCQNTYSIQYWNIKLWASGPMEGLRQTVLQSLQEVKRCQVSIIHWSPA